MIKYSEWLFFWLCKFLHFDSKNWWSYFCKLFWLFNFCQFWLDDYKNNMKHFLQYNYLWLRYKQRCGKAKLHKKIHHLTAVHKRILTLTCSTWFWFISFSVEIGPSTAIIFSFWAIHFWRWTPASLKAEMFFTISSKAFLLCSDKTLISSHLLSVENTHHTQIKHKRWLAKGFSLSC